eukprot:4120263-Prymnesium_polylepis.1
MRRGAIPTCSHEKRSITSRRLVRGSGAHRTRYLQMTTKTIASAMMCEYSGSDMSHVRDESTRWSRTVVGGSASASDSKVSHDQAAKTELEMLGTIQKMRNSSSGSVLSTPFDQCWRRLFRKLSSFRKPSSVRATPSTIPRLGSAPTARMAISSPSGINTFSNILPRNPSLRHPPGNTRGA